MPTLYKIAVLLHVFAAVIWIGGVLFIAMVAVPALKFLDAEMKRDLLIRMGNRFRAVGWSCLGILVVTGIYMMWVWGATFANVLDFSFFASPHTHALGAKLLFVIIMLITSGLHDWHFGPRATDQPLDGRTHHQLRKRAGQLGRATGVLAVLILICAVLVARPWM